MTLEERKELGHAVENGRLRYLSVSSVEKADPRSKGCYKRWAMRYVFHIKEEDKHEEAKQKGTDLHARIAHYLKTGEDGLDSLEMLGKWFLPKPGSDLWIEQKFHSTSTGNVHSMLSAGGIPFVGFIDCAHNRLETKDEDGNTIVDPKGTVEVIDWKRKGNAFDRKKNPLWKQPSELILSVQMAGYGELVRRSQKDATHVRLSHGNFFEKPKSAKKVTKLHVLDDTQATWEYVSGVARNLADIAKVTDLEHVPGNKHACDEFGGCPHRETCSTFRQNALDVLYGDIASSFKETQDMGLLSQVQQPAPAAPDMRQQLAAEEAQMRAQAAPAFNILDVWARIERHGRGTPALGGAAAQAYAAAKGYASSPGIGYSGTGQLAGIQLVEVANFAQLLGELDGQNPALAQPVVAPAPFLQAPMQTPVPTAPAVPTNILPPGAPESIPALAMQQLTPPTIAETYAAAGVPTPMSRAEENASEAPPFGGEAKRGRGRPKKVPDTTPEATAAAAVPSPPPASTGTPATQVPPAMASTSSQASVDSVTRIFIDCVPLGGGYTSLRGYVESINADLSKRYSVTSDGKPGVQDVRCAPKDSILAFGGWKGAVAEVVKASPPPAGATYVLETRGNELYEVVADALATVCDRAGVLYVRGIR